MTALLLTALLWHAGIPARATLAQTPPGAAKQQPQPPSGMPPAAPPAVTPPYQPEVSDPMLAPIPPAPVQVRSWDEALALLRQNSTDLRTALAQVESATGQRRVALSGLLPNLSGSLSVQYNVLNPSVTPFLGGGIGGGTGGGVTGGTGNLATTSPLGTGVLTASLPLFDLHAIQSLRAANSSRRASELSLGETRRQLTAALARALARVASAERLAEVNRVNLRSALERLALTQRRLELGAGTQLDVIRLQQDSETARAAVVSGDETLRQARDSLGLVLGLEKPVGLARDVSLEPMLQRGREECRRLENVGARPDLAASRARQEAAERSVSAALAQYWPTLDAQSTTLALTVTPGFAQVPVWNIGAVLTIPFFTGGANEGLVEQARAQEETARQDVVSRQRAASVEVQQTRRAVEVARAEHEIAIRARELAAENDRLTRRSFEVGTGTSQDLVVSAAALRQTELNLVVREFQLSQARIEEYLAEAACDW
ncbi:TolC family protein [Vitiosangium sp. GDMCC 1.1324]|uniref:TolC family protein n=1 Tax=Vitiosangium sp. (strain GDMCC 1.1324) TaxID=2138576 RepID=UPI000D37174E|nr:TolC family protein [Vitiosangium sp. GDMCC 1.1324]PTL81867.1 MFP transporter [Vitiosangium sp. GDMCC 1.1324]